MTTRSKEDQDELVRRGASLVAVGCLVLLFAPVLFFLAFAVAGDFQRLVESPVAPGGPSAAIRILDHSLK